MEPVRQDILSDRERLAIVENNIHNIKESQSEFREDVNTIQKEVSELSGLIKVNNALLTAMSEDMKKVKDRTEFVPKAVITTVITLGLGFLFTQTTNISFGEPPQAATVSSIMEARIKEEPNLPTKETDPEDETISKD